jgi:hypothetical protein
VLAASIALHTCPLLEGTFEIVVAVPYCPLCVFYLLHPAKKWSSVDDLLLHTGRLSPVSESMNLTQQLGTPSGFADQLAHSQTHIDE